MDNQRRNVIAVEIKKKQIDDTSHIAKIESCTNDDQIFCLLDLDGLFGNLGLKNFAKYYKCLIQFKLDANSRELITDPIKTKFPIMTEDGLRYVRDLNYIKFGTSKTRVGTMNLYLVFQNCYMTEMNAIKLKLLRKFNQILSSHDKVPNSCQSFTRVVENGQCISLTGILSNLDYETVFGDIEDKFGGYSVSLYCETFGNKDETRTPIKESFKMEEMITEIIDDRMLRYFLCDLCLAVSCGNKRLTFANKFLFEALCIAPNYYPLLSRSIMNANFIPKLGKKVFLANNRRLKIYKYNLYSTYKLVFSRKFMKDFRTNFSTELMCRRLYNCDLKALKEVKNRHFAGNYNVVSKFENRVSQEYFYRLEFTCKVSKIKDFVEFLALTINKRNFSSCDSREFFTIVGKSLDNSLNFISKETRDSVLTFGDLIKAAIVESITNTLYIKGEKSISVLSSRVNRRVPEILRPTQDYIKIFNLKHAAESIYLLLETNDKIKILKSLVTYNKEFSDLNKDLFKSIFGIYYSLPKEEYVEEFMNFYICEHSQNKLNYSVLIDQSNSVLSKSRTFDNWFSQNISVANTNMKSSLSRFLYEIIIQTLNITSDEFKSSMKNFMIQKKIHTMIKSIKGGSFESFKLCINPIVDRHTVLNEDLSKYHSTSFNTTDTSYDELVRFFSARYIYKSDRAREISILNDPSYGFFLIRNRDWIKNRKRSMNQILTNEDVFIKFVKDVVKWTPFDYSIQERICDLRRADVIFTFEQLLLFKEYLDISVEKWIALRNDFDFSQLSLFDFWFIGVGKTPFYNSKLDMIKSWCGTHCLAEFSVNLVLTGNTIPQISDFEFRQIMGSNISTVHSGINSEPSNDGRPTNIHTLESSHINNTVVICNDPGHLNITEMFNKMSEEINIMKQKLEIFENRLSEIDSLKETVDYLTENKISSSGTVLNLPDGNHNVFDDMVDDGFDQNIDNLNELEANNIGPLNDIRSQDNSDLILVIYSKLGVAKGLDKGLARSLCITLKPTMSRFICYDSLIDSFPFTMFTVVDVQKIFNIDDEVLIIEILGRLIKQNAISAIDSVYFKCNLRLNPDSYLDEVYLLAFLRRNFEFTIFSITFFRRLFHKSERPEKKHSIFLFNSLLQEKKVEAIDYCGYKYYLLK